MQANIEQPIQGLNCNKNFCIMDHRYGQQITEFLNKNYTIQSLHELAIDLKDEDIIRRHRGVIGIRKILSVNPVPIQEVIDEGAVPTLISFAKSKQVSVGSSHYSEWESFPISAGDKAWRNFSVYQFIEIQKKKLFERAVNGIGNMAINSNDRDEIIRKGGVRLIVKFAKRFRNQKFLKYCCWALSNLCRGDPLPKDKKIEEGVYFLFKAVGNNLIHKDILVDCFWVISYHTEQIMNQGQQLIANLITQLVRNCEETNQVQPSILFTSIRILRKLTLAGKYINYLLRFNALKILQRCINHRIEVIRMQSCWVISNIAAGTQQQVNMMLQSQSLVKSLLNSFQNGSIYVKIEICYVFSNLTFQGNPHTVFNFYNSSKITGYYYRLLNVDATDDDKTVQSALECLYCILAFARKYTNTANNVLVDHLKQQGGLIVLQKWKCHQSDRIVYFSQMILTILNQM